MSNRWTHSICDACWMKRNPGRKPFRVVEEYRDEKPVPCCYCGTGNQSGIWVRDDPAWRLRRSGATLRCNGQHGE